MAALAAEIPKLTSDNWMEFKPGMEMLFIGANADYLIDPTSSTSIPSECVKIDKQLVFYIWSRVDAQFRYLVQDSRSSALQAWIALLTHFQKSTMPRRIAARQQLYSVTHDPSKPIESFIHSVTSAAKVLADLGHKIEDTEIGDILLMKLDESYAGARTTIMTCKEEPDLATIKSLLLTASSSFSQLSTQHSSSFSQFSSVSPVANAASTHHVGQQFNSRTSHSSPSHSELLTLPSVDQKGFQWCNPTNHEACHRCGRTNHIAAYCLFAMPQHVKDWVMQGGYKKHSANFATSSEEFVYSVDTGQTLDPPLSPLDLPPLCC